MTLWSRRFVISSLALAALVFVPQAAQAAKTPTPTFPVSGATATVTVNDGVTSSGQSVKPFQAQLRIVAITFPKREGANQALPGNVFVHVALRVTNLASGARLIPFNGNSTKTMAMGISHDVAGVGVSDAVCMPPALDGLATNLQVASTVANQWCVLDSTLETPVIGAHKSKVVTFGGQIVSQTDAKAANFALIYCPADSATPTILPVGPGGSPTTVPS